MASNYASNLCLMASLELRNSGSVLILFMFVKVQICMFSITLEMVWYCMMQNFRPPFLLLLVWLFNCFQHLHQPDQLYH